MAQDSTTYYVWIGGSCDYGHKEPTHEARAETKLVWALPCKKEEDEVNRRTKEEQRPNLFELCLARRRNTKSTDARSKSRGKLA